jgi:hypothetical protein
VRCNAISSPNFDKDDWYDIQSNEITKLGGVMLIQMMSLSDLLIEWKPFHPWQPWRFHPIPAGIWEDPKWVEQFLEWSASKLDVRKPEDWYEIETASLGELGGKDFHLMYFKLTWT